MSLKVRITIEDDEECVYAQLVPLEIGPHIARDIVTAVSVASNRLLESIEHDIREEWRNP